MTDTTLHAVRLARERICGAVNDGWPIKADDVAVILRELDRLRAEDEASAHDIARLKDSETHWLNEAERLRAELDEQRERAEEAESEITRAQEQVSAEFEGDCWKTLRNLLNRAGFDWSEYSEDGVTASDAQEWIVEELDRLEADRGAAWRAGAEAMRAASISATDDLIEATREDDGLRERREGLRDAADAIRALPLPGQPKEGG